MAEYALYAVLHFQRRMSDYFEQQRTVIWQRRDELLARQWPVGVMGLGVIGATVAQRIGTQGYPVIGWSRSGSYVVNIGRGGHMVDVGLITALDSGQLAGAMLDRKSVV